MKKNNYLTLFGNHQQKNKADDEKRLKISKNHVNPISIKSFKSKCHLQKLHKNAILKQQKRHVNKENIHPNIYHQVIDNLKDIEKKLQIKTYTQIIPQYSIHQDRERIEIPNKKNTKQQDKIDKKYNNVVSSSISLSHCNFEPNHNNQNLFLIQLGTKQQMIACQKCAQKFGNRINISQLQQKFNKQNIKKQKTKDYSQIVNQHFTLSQHKQKLKNLQEIQKNRLKQNLNKIQYYYSKLISQLIELKTQTQKSILQIYEQNKIEISLFSEQIVKKIDKLSKVMSNMENQCNLNKHQIEQNKQLMDIQFYECFKINMKIELDQFFIEIPQKIHEKFYKCFKQSQFYLSSHTNQPQTPENIENPIKQPQNSQKLNQQKIDSKLTQENEANHIYSSTKMQENLPSQELLIQSVRNQDSDRLNLDIIKNNFQHKTQASTERIDNHTPELKDHSFIKMIHAEDLQYSDLICDEDLSLSNTHPIHGALNTRKDKKSKSNSSTRNRQISAKSDLKLFEDSLTLNQLNCFQPKLDSSQNSLIANPSIITIQNNNEISFQLDENLIVDFDILPSQQNETENFDIISPAFKII